MRAVVVVTGWGSATQWFESCLDLASEAIEVMVLVIGQPFPRKYKHPTHSRQPSAFSDAVNHPPSSHRLNPAANKA